MVATLPHKSASVNHRAVCCSMKLAGVPSEDAVAKNEHRPQTIAGLTSLCHPLRWFSYTTDLLPKKATSPRICSWTSTEGMWKYTKYLDRQFNPADEQRPRMLVIDAALRYTAHDQSTQRPAMLLSIADREYQGQVQMAPRTQTSGTRYRQTAMSLSGALCSRFRKPSASTIGLAA